MLDILFSCSIAPVALLLFFIYKKDSIKEPPKQLCKSYFLGVATIFPIMILELVVSIFISNDTTVVGSGFILFLSVLIGIGMIEELFKWVIVRFANYNNKHFDESFDAIVYATFVSLGFATIENLMYVFLSFLTNPIGSLITIVGRFVAAVPGHCFFGIIMGYYFARAKRAQVSNEKKKESLNLWLAFVIPTLLHTLYDYFLMSERITNLLLWVFLVIAFYTVGIIIVFKASKENKIFNTSIGDGSKFQF